MSTESTCAVCGSSTSQVYPPGHGWTCGDAEDALQEEHVRARPIMEWVQAVVKHAVTTALAAHEASRMHVKHAVGCVAISNNVGVRWRCVLGCPVAALEAKESGT